MWPQASNFTSMRLGIPICREQVVIPLRVTRKIINTEWGMPSLMTAGLQKCQLFIISYHFSPSPSSSPPPHQLLCLSPLWFKKKKKDGRKKGFFSIKKNQNPYSDFSFLWFIMFLLSQGLGIYCSLCLKCSSMPSSPNQCLLTLSSGGKNPFLTACFSCPDILPQSMESLWFDSITSCTGW